MTIEDLITLLLKINTRFSLSVRHLMPYIVLNFILSLMLLLYLIRFVLLRAINGL